MIKTTDVGIPVERCRSVFRLPALATATRKCLRCNNIFTSEGNHNRICQLCKVDYRTLPTTIADDYMPPTYRSTLRRMLENRKIKRGL